MIEHNTENLMEHIEYICNSCEALVPYAQGPLTCSNKSCTGTNFRKLIQNETYSCF